MRSILLEYCERVGICLLWINKIVSCHVSVRQMGKKELEPGTGCFFIITLPIASYIFHGNGSGHPSKHEFSLPKD
jgi:hypothetical protein